MIRAIGTRGAVAINVITMIGIGPLITIPLVLASLHGPLSLAGWIIGAALALCDGLVWAELGSRFPASGGTYEFLRHAFPPRVGSLLAFLFVWQMIFAGPLLVASGYIGFADYAAYLVPQLAVVPWGIKLCAAGVGVVTLFALYRRITIVSRIGTWLAIAAFATLFFVTIAGYAHWSAHLAFALPAGEPFWGGLAGGLGSALVITLYDYAGYGQITYLGDEVVTPSRTLPRAIVASIVLVAVVYLLMQIAVLGAMPWQHLNPNFPGSQVVEHSFGRLAAIVVTILILLTAFASVYGNLLGFSRIPYAAATDGQFLAPFASLHSRGKFPTVSLVVMGLLAIAACAFTLDQVISALTAGLVLVQSIAQIAGLMLVRTRGSTSGFRMPLYPVPAIVALIGWLAIFFYTGFWPILFGCVTLALGALLYVAQRRNPAP